MYVSFFFVVTDKIDFVRDVVAYLLVVCLVVGVAYDGTVSQQPCISFGLFCELI